MIYKGKYKIIDNLITACDYDFLLKKIEESISKKSSLLISPIASHTLVRAYYDNNLKKILDNFDYLVPDSQWVRWSIPFLYGKDINLEDRVYGPDLMLKVCNLSWEKFYKVFLYGNTSEVLAMLEKHLKNLFPGIKICGKEESKFRELTKKERENLVKKIKIAEANIVFISLGSPKQEIFSYQLSKLVKKSLIIIPVGAAFDFIAGIKKQASKWISDLGFEWLYRLIFEKKRLLKRYLFYGLIFQIMILKKYVLLRIGRK